MSDRTKASACAALISVTLLTLDVQAPQSQAEYDRIADDSDLRLETLSARRRGVSMMQPKLRQKLDREFMSVAAEKAAYTTAYAVQAEQKAMAAYESSPMAKEQKETIERGVAAARERLERMAEEAEQKRLADAKKIARDTRRWYGGPQ